MGNIWEMVGGIMISFGGAGAIVLVIIKFSSNIIIDKLSKKYQHLLDEKLEAHKFVLDKKNFISKIRFDAEFAIYKSLSGKVLDMVFKGNALYPALDNLPVDKEELKNMYVDRLKEAVDSYNIANREIQANAPFIPKEIYPKFTVLRDSCLNRISLFRTYVIIAPENDYYKERDKIYGLNDSIDMQQESLINGLREYLSNLEVLG